MSNDTNQESIVKKGGNGNVNIDQAPKSSLSYKDWKNLKDGKSKANETSRKTKSDFSSNLITKNKGNDYRGNINSNNNNMIFRGPSGQNMPNFFTGNNYQSSFMPPNNFNGNNFNNNFRPGGNNNFRYSNNGLPFDNFNGNNNMSFNNNNHFNRNFQNGFNNSNGPNNFGNDRSTINGFNNGDNLNLPDVFFAFDGIYRQKDLMQKPLPNPFRNDQKAEHLLQEFDKSRYTKEDKKKKGNKNSADAKKSISAKDLSDTLKQASQPKVYIPNPKSRTDGKPYIPKPKIPEENLDISKEEKKQQWKEYREAMKPFKNREFYNAKRVVQRLGKKSLSELNEKEIIRLENSHKIMADHKARLAEKYPNYVKDNDNSNNQGELYILKKQPFNPSGLETSRQPENFGNFGGSNLDNNFESGRKILGGYTEFVSGGILEGTDEMYTE